MQRDELGIPTIVADTTDDLFFAQGYVHAQDRFWEMDFRRHVTSGRLSELFGESQLPTDKFLRTLGWREVAEQEVEALDPTIARVLRGLRRRRERLPRRPPGRRASLEYAVLGLQNADYEIEPWTPADSVAWLKAMAWDLRTNIEDETERAHDRRRLHRRRDRRAVPGLSVRRESGHRADDHRGACRRPRGSSAAAPGSVVPRRRSSGTRSTA